jgi:hypothetical protein
VDRIELRRSEQPELTKSCTWSVWFFATMLQNQLVTFLLLNILSYTFSMVGINSLNQGGHMPLCSQKPHCI